MHMVVTTEELWCPECPQCSAGEVIIHMDGLTATPSTRSTETPQSTPAQPPATNIQHLL